MKTGSGHGVWRALLVTVVAIAVMFVASTWGVSAWHRSLSVPDSGSLALPAAVDNAPPSVATTDEYGPPGAVSMVYAGTQVDDGLLGQVERPWITLAARTGDYRALSAPDLPVPGQGRLAVTESGGMLAWATGAGVALYDTATGDTRKIPLAGATQVGDFSPDGTQLLVHADGLRVLDVGTGEVVAEVSGTTPDQVRRAAWRPGGTAVDFVDGEQLVTLALPGGAVRRHPTAFAGDAELAWAPAGDRLVGLQDVSGIKRLLEAPARGQGRVGAAQQVDTPGISLERLLGFSGEHTVAVSAYLLESGAVERVIDVPLDGGSPVDVVTLPSSGDNWIGSHTLSVAEDALRAGSTDFGSQAWPWRDLARLVACVLVGLFGFGMWLTRRPRRR